MKIINLTTESVSPQSVVLEKAADRQFPSQAVISKSIQERFIYLNSVIREVSEYPEDYIEYKKNRDVLIKILNYVVFEDIPFIGVAEDGTMMAELIYYSPLGRLWLSPAQPDLAQYSILVKNATSNNNSDKIIELNGQKTIKELAAYSRRLLFPTDFIYDIN
jgi:hypothetical protein